MDYKRFITPLLMVAALVSCSTGKQGLTLEAKDEKPTGNVEAAYIKEGEEKKLPFWGGLFTQVCNESQKENICISPLSAQLALSMTAVGATGETQQQMYSTINQTGDVNAAAKETIKELADSRYECEVSIANSIWINEILDVKESFIDTNKEYYNAFVTTAPFNRETLLAINSWCSDNTKGKIKDALSDIKENDRMYLINALYFKGAWDNKFDAEKTEEKPFTKEDGSRVDVSMMNQTIKTQYYEDEFVQVTIKRFTHRYQMLLVLPAEGVKTADAIAHFSENYERILCEMSTYEVTLYMPKFQCEFGASLKEQLKRMGMPRAFGKDAQFDGISDEQLYVDDIFQKTFINVDEIGAEAAAVTVLRAGLLAANRKPEKRTMNLDRPFMYLITDYKPENILFIGKIGNPNEQ